MTLKSIEENAIIKVTSAQISDESSDTVELITTGSFCQRGKKFYIFYKENEEMEMANCSVMLIAGENRVTMRRTGDFELKFTYVEGESESVIYYMPFGEMNITQETHSVSCDLSDSGGIIKIIYTLYIGGGQQRNELEIKVERK